MTLGTPLQPRSLAARCLAQPPSSSCLAPVPEGSTLSPPAPHHVFSRRGLPHTLPHQTASDLAQGMIQSSD